MPRRVAGAESPIAMEQVHINVDSPRDAAVEDVDAVYLWVDGTDQSFQKSINQYLPLDDPSVSCDSMSARRFRDNGELKYSLRSLELYAPWIRRIHLITNGQVPDWLDQSNPKIVVVPHDRLFPRKSDLPTFNSNAIELQLHRIPNLSRLFLYLNDDVFFGAPTTLDTFLLPDGSQRVFLQETPLHDRTDSGPVHDRSYAYTQQVIDKTWGHRRQRLLPAHVPQLYNKEIIADIERTIPREFENTSSHRFRSADDLVLRIVYIYRILEREHGGNAVATVLQETTEDYYFARLERSIVSSLVQLLRIATLRPHFFCINDDVDDSIGPRLLIRTLPWFLSAIFPNRSAYEIER